MGDAPPVPTPQNPTAVASQQADYNFGAGTASQAGSMVNQNNPYGSLSYNQTGVGPGGVPIYSSNVSLTPQLQSLVSSLMGQSNNLISGANYGGQAPADVIGGMTSGTTKDLLDKHISYLQPFFNTQREQLDTKLRNQGFAPGQPGYDNAMRGMDTNQNQSVQSFLAQAQPEAYKQAVSSYTLPLQLAASEMGLVDPGFLNKALVNPPQLNIGPPDYTGAVNSYNNAQQAAYEAKSKANSAMLSGLFGIPSALLGGWATGGLSGLGGLGGLTGAFSRSNSG